VTLVPRIELHLQQERRPGIGAPISVVGSVSVESGAPTPFVGWIELLTLLESSLPSSESTDP
jgi:hypothetical protein